MEGDLTRRCTTLVVVSLDNPSKFTWCATKQIHISFTDKFSPISHSKQLILIPLTYALMPTSHGSACLSIHFLSTYLPSHEHNVGGLSVVGWLEEYVTPPPPKPPPQRKLFPSLSLYVCDIYHLELPSVGAEYNHTPAHPLTHALAHSNKPVTRLSVCLSVKDRSRPPWQQHSSLLNRIMIGWCTVGIGHERIERREHHNRILDQ